MTFLLQVDVSGEGKNKAPPKLDDEATRKLFLLLDMKP